jgi:hypothetical protein
VGIYVFKKGNATTVAQTVQFSLCPIIRSIATDVEGLFLYCDKKVLFFRTGQLNSSITRGDDGVNCSATAVPDKGSLFYEQVGQRLWVAETSWNRLVFFQPFTTTSSVFLFPPPPYQSCRPNEGGVSATSSK